MIVPGCEANAKQRPWRSFHGRCWIAGTCLPAIAQALR